MVNRVVGYQKVVIRFVGWRIMANRGGSTQKVANWFGSAQKLVNRGWGADFVLSGYYSFFFDWWLFGHRATALVGVALINVSQFFFSADHGNRVRSAVIRHIHLYRNVHEFPKSTTCRPLSYNSTYRLVWS